MYVITALSTLFLHTCSINTGGCSTRREQRLARKDVFSKKRSTYVYIWSKVGTQSFVFFLLFLPVRVDIGDLNLQTRGFGMVGVGGLKLHNVCIRIRTGWNSPILRLIVSVIIHIAICNTEINLAQNILWNEGFHVLFRLRSYEHHAEPGEYIMYRHVSFNTVEVRVK